MLENTELLFVQCGNRRWSSTGTNVWQLHTELGFMQILLNKVNQLYNFTYSFNYITDIYSEYNEATERSPVDRGQD
jgi:hypothetical protein